MSDILVLPYVGARFEKLKVVEKDFYQKTYWPKELSSSNQIKLKSISLNRNTVYFAYSFLFFTSRSILIEAFFLFIWFSWFLVIARYNSHILGIQRLEERYSRWLPTLAFNWLYNSFIKLIIPPLNICLLHESYLQ